MYGRYFLRYDISLLDRKMYSDISVQYFCDYINFVYYTWKTSCINVCDNIPHLIDDM